MVQWSRCLRNLCRENGGRKWEKTRGKWVHFGKCFSAELGRSHTCQTNDSSILLFSHISSNTAMFERFFTINLKPWFGKRLHWAITWNYFPFEFNTWVGAHLSFEIRSIHFLTLRTIAQANAHKIKVAGRIYGREMKVDMQLIERCQICCIHWARSHFQCVFGRQIVPISRNTHRLSGYHCWTQYKVQPPKQCKRTTYFCRTSCLRYWINSINKQNEKRFFALFGWYRCDTERKSWSKECSSENQMNRNKLDC